MFLAYFRGNNQNIITLDVAGKSVVELAAEGSVAPIDFEGELLKANNA